MLSAELNRRALPRYHSEEMKILNISFTPVGIELTTCRVHSRTLAPLRENWPHINNLYIKQAL